MSWELRVYTPLGGPHVSGSQIASYTPSSPGGIVGEMRWTVRPNGDCVQLEFQAVPKLVDIPPRAIVQLLWQNNPVFYGFITQSWPNTDGKARRYVALGARHLLRYRYVSNEWPTGGDVGALAQQVWQAANHPAIQLPTITNAGYSLSYLGVPGVDAYTVLERLAQVVPGTTWGVRATGQGFWSAVGGVSTVDSLDLDELPIMAEEIYDWVRFIAPPPSSGSLAVQVGDNAYGSERAVLITDDILDPLTITDIGIDVPSDALQYTLDGGSTWQNCSTSSACVPYLQDGSLSTGVRAHTTLTMMVNTSIRIFWTGTLVKLRVQGQFQYNLVELRLDTLRRVYPYMQHDFMLVPALGNVDVAQGVPPGVLITVLRATLFEARGLGLATTAQRVAQSLAAMPYVEPAEGRSPGYVSPNPQLFVRSLNKTLPASEYEYRLSPQRGLETLVRIGTTASQQDPLAAGVRIVAARQSASVSGELRLSGIRRQG